MLNTLRIFALCSLAVTGMLGYSGSAQAQTRVSVGFDYGIIGEANNNAHQPKRGVRLSTLGMSQVIISQLTDNGQFGGTQGNDYDVDVTVLFNNGTTTTFTAAVNWRDTSGSTTRGIGLIRPLGSAADGSGYTPQSGYYTSYLLRFVNQTIIYSETAAGVKIPEVSGNAATSGLLDSLNAYLRASPPSSTPSALQTTLTANSTSIAADGTTTSTITIQLKDVNGNNLSASGGTVRLNTDAGTLNSVTNNGDGTYTATLTSATTAGTATITGTLGGTAITDDATVTMTDAGPTITGPDGSGGTTTGAISAISLDENQTAVTTVTADETVTWTLTGSDDDAKFAINASTGVITFVAAPDYENANDVGDTANNNTYVMTITATDTATNTSTQTLTVTVLDLDDAGPTITGPDGSGGTTTGAISAISLDENQTAVTTVTADETVTWTLTGSDDDAKFAINASTGVITFVAAPDYENANDVGDTANNNTYVMTITATDTATNTSTQTLTVTVLDLDDAGPTITGPDGSGGTTTGAISAISLDENQTAVTTVTADETVTWTLTGSDDDAKFAINASTGVITFVAAPDYENANDVGDTANNNTYVMTITATDTATNTSTQTLTVTVLDLDDAGPTITGPDGSGGTTTGAISAISLDENQTAVTTVTADETVTWTLTGSDDDAKFAINASTGVITFVAAPDYENANDVGDTANNNTYVMTITATDTATNTSTQTLTVTVLDLDDAGPTITGPDGSGGTTTGANSAISLDENQTAVTTVTADETVTWTLTGSDDDAKFAINASTGVITFVAAPDYENANDVGDTANNNTYVMTITATDTATNTSTQTLTVTVLDLDDDLVDQIRNPLKDILQSDFEQTVATQSRQFSQFSKGALGRLQSDEEERCGVVEVLDADGRAQAGAGGFNTSGVFGEEYYDCETGVRRILDGSFAINRSDIVDAQSIVSLTIQHEKQKADEALNGNFFGGYISSSSLDGVATGNLRGVGFHAGMYGARKLQSDLFFDYYAGGGVGRHEYDVSFNSPSAPITAEGDYRYGAVYAGAALSGETVYESVMFRPRVGFDLTYAYASDASVSASQMGFADLGRIQIDAINGSRIYAETIWIFGVESEDLVTEELSLERALEVAPRFYCEQGVGRDESDCGYGGYVRFNEHNLSKDSDIAITLDYETNTEGSERFGLDLSYSRDVFNGAGKLATQVGSDASGNATVSQSLSIEF